VTSPSLSAAERLTAAGQRLTVQRVVVADALLRSRRTVTAQELFERLRPRHPSLGRATVFRTLEVLVDAGIAQRFERSGHAGAYVACEPTHHHHLVCRACGGSTDIDDEEVAVLVEAVRARHGFVLDHDALDFHGVCRRCDSAGG
jgi:Fur family ferric uptake transcriptional regulator